jgi:hypothetical protein
MHDIKKDFGAKGDGQTDDSATCARAFNNSDILRVP